MNKLEKYRSYRVNLNQIQRDCRCGNHTNCIRINSHNSRQHEETKFYVCEILNKAGYDFISEAVFLDNKRADVYCIELNTAYEVLCSETEAECDLKGYPVPIIKIKTGMTYDEIKRRIL